MPYYRNPQDNDGFDDFDDFDDFDNMDSTAADDGFDSFDDFDESMSQDSFAEDGFDDFDDEPVRKPMEQPASQSAPMGYREPVSYPHGEDFDPGPAKPPKEHKVRKFILTLLSLVLIIGGMGVTAHFDSGFVPADILSWHIGTTTVGDLLKIGHAEDLLEHVPQKVVSDTEPVYTEDTMPDSVRWADFDIYEGNTYCSVNGYNGTELEIVLPASYNGKPCTRIEANAFSNSPVTSIEIPDSYTFIGQTAFSGCSITDLYLPDSITEIGWGMCSGNKALKSVRLPNSLEVISEWSFANCTSITKLEIPGTVKTVGQWAFTDCTSIDDLTLNEGTVTLDNCAFYGCTSLDILIVPQSVTYIGEMCFRSCTSLVIASLPETVETVGKNAFMNCSKVLTFFGEKDGKWQSYAKKYDFYFDLIENLDLSETSDTTETEDTSEAVSDTDTPVSESVSPTDASPSDIQ